MLGMEAMIIGSPNVNSVNFVSSKSQKYFLGTAVKLGSFRRRIAIEVAVVTTGTPNENRKYHLSKDRSVDLLPWTTRSQMLKPIHAARRLIARGVYCSRMAEIVQVMVPRACSMLKSGYMKRKKDSQIEFMTLTMQKTRRR
jgi:hypothetical protein